MTDFDISVLDSGVQHHLKRNKKMHLDPRIVAGLLSRIRDLETQVCMLEGCGMHIDAEVRELLENRKRRP